MHIQASKKGQHVVFIDKKFVNGFATGIQIGALEFDPAKFKTVAEAVTAAKKLKVKLVPQEDSDVLCDVIVL